MRKQRTQQSHYVLYNYKKYILFVFLKIKSLTWIILKHLIIVLHCVCKHKIIIRINAINKILNHLRNMNKKIFYFKCLVLCFVLIVSCNKSTTIDSPDNALYSIIDHQIYRENAPIQLIGANTLHSFAVGSSDIPNWNLNIVREFIGNVKENPITGYPIQDSNGSYLHALQAIVDDNRANNLVTILCPFGWDGTTTTLFTGKRPSETQWNDDFKAILKQWATHFNNQEDVWIEVWNEPYRYDRTDGYTDTIWLNDMNELYTIIRNENSSIILIPCAEQGQDESVLLNVGNTFLNNKTNVLFDVHAYEKWLLDSNQNVNMRLNSLKAANLPVFFGEIAPVNSGILMNPEYVLNTLHTEGFSIAAWLWKYDETDQDALLTIDGLPNNNDNNNWGDVFKELASRPRLN